MPISALAVLLLSISVPPSGEGRTPARQAGLSRAIAGALAGTGHAVHWQVGTPFPDAPAAWTAANRASGVRAYFTAGGLRMVPRNDELAWHVGLALAAVGREERLESVGPSGPRVAGNRVEYDRGDVVEWYVNDDRGLEQGFTLARRPAGAGPLLLEVAVSGTLRAEVAAGGRGARFLDAGGARRATYEALRAFDATGRELSARLEVRGGCLVVAVEDRGATYPVVVDPLLGAGEEQLTAPGSPNFGRMGHSIALAGDVAVIGAPGASFTPGNAGAAYVLQRVAPATWVLRAKLLPHDGAPNHDFGASVAVTLSGDYRVLVGDPLNGSQGFNTGAAYVFLGTPDALTWTFEQRLLQPDANPTGTGSERFGESVAASGDWLMVGAPRDDEAALNAGAVYVYRNTATGYAFHQKVVPFTVSAGDRFGSAVACDEPNAVVGAPFADDLSGNPTGQAYGLGLSGTQWSVVSGFLPTFPTSRYGASVSVKGQFLAIGAPETDGAKGAVFVYRGPSFGLDAFFTGAAAGDEHGRSVSIDGTGRLWIGVPGDDTIAPDAGAVRALRSLAAHTWGLEGYVRVANGAAGDRFGSAVARDGTRGIAGAPQRDNATSADDHDVFAEGQGYAFEYTGSKNWTFDGTMSGANACSEALFGTDVALDGSTAVVGASGDRDHGAYTGAAYVLAREGGSWVLQAKLGPVHGFGSTFLDFGKAVAVSGDTVAVGGSGNDQGATDAGAVWVFERTGSAWGSQARLFAPNPAQGDRFGSAVALDGDLLLAGTPLADVSGPDSGAVHVFVRTGTSWSHQTTLAPLDGAAGDRFGWSVALDGTTALIGAVEDDAPLDSGSAYVFEYDGAGWALEAKLTTANAVAFDRFGGAVDVDGDRVVVGATGADPHGSSSGAAYVFERGATGTWSEVQRLDVPQLGIAAFVGRSVAIAGSSIAVGAHGDDTTADNGGGVFLFQRRSLGWELVERLENGPLTPQSSLGWSCALDGGLCLAGAPQADVDFWREGLVEVFEVPLTGVAYCSGKTNSLGCLPFVATVGTPSATDPSPFRIEAHDVVPGEAGILIYASKKAALPFHGGTLCVKVPFTRLLPPKSPATVLSATCPAPQVGFLSRNFNALIQSGADGRLTAGHTVHAQWVQRDPGDPAGFGDGLTNAVSFEIRP